MAEFKYVTRLEQSPQGKQKVYFTCHPQDFEPTFEEIKKDIFNRQNVAIFYLEPDTRPQDVEDYELRLGEMQLFVLPITTKLLTTPNRAMDYDVPFAQERHIPILPLMRESGLDELFNVKFGGLQYLDKFNTDPTAIPFDEKLTKYLEAVIVGDELAEKVRAAFDAYIFLSYRKKDREQAQELMRLIHENEFARDIAIWYDEFLTPGEDFNSAIKAALEKSDLFALTVTPNLLEMPDGKPNFVMDKEFPIARDSGKPILPAEMLETDRDALNEKYTDIPEPVGGEDKTGLSERLSELLKKLAITENDKDPQHNYFIGLAYLSGIDVEVNNERAAELIEGSANSGFIPAVKKLVDMYNTGKGVKRDYHKAVEWQEKLAKTYEGLCFTHPCLDNGFKYINALDDLGSAYMAIGQYKSAQEIYNVMEQNCRVYFERTQELFFLFKHYIVCRQLGGVFHNLGDLEKAEEWEHKGLTSLEAFAKKDNSLKSRRGLANAYFHFGNLLKLSGNPQKAKEWYIKRKAILDSVSADEESEKERIARAVEYRQQGDIAMEQGDTENAEELYNKSYQISKEIAEHTGSADARSNLSYCYIHLGRCMEMQDRYLEAKKWYEKSIELFISVDNELCTVESRFALSSSYAALGNVAAISEKYIEAEELFRKSIDIIEPLIDHTDSFLAKQDLAVTCIWLGEVIADQGRYIEAKSLFDKALKILQTINRASNDSIYQNALKRLMCDIDTINSILPVRNDLGYAVSENSKNDNEQSRSPKENNTDIRINEFGSGAYLQKDNEYGNTRESQSESPNDRRSMINESIRKGEIAVKNGKRGEALVMFGDALKHAKELAEETNAYDDQSNVCLCYERLGDIAQTNGVPTQAEKNYRSAIDIRRQIARDSREPNQRHKLAISCYQLGSLLSDEQLMKEAQSIWSELAGSDRNNQQYREYLQKAEQELSKHKGGMVTKLFARRDRKRDKKK